MSSKQDRALASTVTSSYQIQRVASHTLDPKVECSKEEWEAARVRGEKRIGEGIPICYDKASCCMDMRKCASNFSCCCDKIPDEGILKKEGFTCVGSLKECRLSWFVRNARLLITLYLH